MNPDPSAPRTAPGSIPITPNAPPPRRARFPLGAVVITATALARLGGTPDAYAALRRHAAGDWGDLDPEDARRNDEALARGFRLLSAYGSGAARFWIITEADRSATTILLPEDY